MEAHGGRIHVHSGGVGQGTRITFTLPAAGHGREAGREVPLTPTEYEIMRLLSRNAGRVTTFEALLRHGWSGKKTGNANLVRNFVKKLRTKLGEDATTPSWIFNVRGAGYRMPKPMEPNP